MALDLCTQYTFMCLEFITMSFQCINVIVFMFCKSNEVIVLSYNNISFCC